MLPSMPQIDGLTLETAAQSATIKVGKTATIDSFLKLLAWLPERCRLGFYDQYYPRISDYGAYVDIQRDGDRLFYKMANHGWSSGWAMQSGELIAAWLALNLKRKGMFGLPLDSIRMDPAGDLPLAPTDP